MYRESKGNINAKGSHGEVGLMQLKPQFHLTRYARQDWRKPSVNIRVGAGYLKHCFELYESVEKTLSCYNLGEGSARTKLSPAYIRDVLRIRATMKDL